jgi:hypothetical protein
MSILVKSSNRNNTTVKQYIIFRIVVVLVKLLLSFKCPITARGLALDCDDIPQSQLPKRKVGKRNEYTN